MKVESSEVLLRVDNLVIHFPIKRGIIIQKTVGAVHAVDGISFNIQRSETLGLVGESGCGKSTAGRTILQSYRPTAGHVHYGVIDQASIQGEELRKMRRKMQMIFQDPYASINTRMTVGEIVGESLVIHHLTDKRQTKQRIEELLELVGLSARFYNRFPHEFSGGQRQRIGVARAISLNPDLIVCDEPISALDVSIENIVELI